jgi:hypothetical protein
VAELVGGLASGEARVVQLGRRGLTEHVARDPGELLGSAGVSEIATRVRRGPPTAGRVGEDWTTTTRGELATADHRDRERAGRRKARSPALLSVPFRQQATPVRSSPQSALHEPSASITNSSITRRLSARVGRRRW